MRGRAFAPEVTRQKCCQSCFSCVVLYMQKIFLRNLLFIFSINLIVKPLYVFGVEVGVQNTLGATTYGLYFALLNSAYLLQILNDFGLQVFNNREVAIDRGQLASLVPGLGRLKLGLSVLFLILLAFLGLALGYRGDLYLLLIIGLNLILASFVLFVRSGISGLGLYRTDSLLSALDKLLMVLIIGGFLFFLPFGRFTLLHFVLGQTASFALTLLVAWLLLMRHGAFVRRRIPIEQIKGLARRALPYALIVFLMTLYTRSDGVMIKALLPDGNYEAGIYAAGYRILDALNMIAFLFAVMLLPMFSKALSSEEQLNALLDEGMRYMAALVIPVCIFSVLYAQQVMHLLYVQADAYWATVFARLMITFAATGVMYVLGTLLTAAGKIRSMNYIYGVTVALNVLLNFALIPVFKAAGAALATLVTQLFAAASIAFLCRRLVSIRIRQGFLVGLSGYTLGCLGCFWLTHLLWPTNAWVWSVPVLCVITVLLAIFFRLVRLSELGEVLRHV